MVVISSMIIVAALLAVAHSQTTPKDPNNCRLNSTSLYSWIVQIWDEKRPGGAGTASIGSLITYRAVLTTAWYFSKFDLEYDLDRYSIYGQNIWDYREPGNYDAARANPCRQERKIKTLNLHPKAISGGQLGKLLFDFSIIYMDQVFNISSNLFPVMHYLRNVREYISALRQIYTPFSLDCRVPTPETDKNRSLVFNRYDHVRPLTFKACVSFICGDSYDCNNTLMSSAKNTLLCMVPYWTKDFNIPTRSEIGDYPTYLAGSPLICATHVFGISTQEKRRSSLPGDFQQTFFFIITLLRIWRWLSETVVLYSPDPKPYSTPKGPLLTQFFFDPTIKLASYFDTNVPARATGQPRSRLFNQDRKTVSAGSRSCTAVLMSFGAFQLLLNFTQ